MTSPTASCFISYNHADKPLARAIRDGLRERNYRVWIDEGELRIGDSLVTAISEAIDQVDFLIALVSENSVTSNWCQKEIAFAMTGEIHRQGITVLPCRIGDVTMPPSIADKLYLPIQDGDPHDAVTRLDDAITRHLAPTEPLPQRRRSPATSPTRAKPRAPRTAGRYDPTADVRMTGIDLDSMTSPRNDGTRGSALYMVPIILSATPDELWTRAFVQHFDHPSQFTTMHRPGIASVRGNRILLDGTTVEEVEQYHLATLKLAVAAANADRRAYAQHVDARRSREAAERDAHRRAAEEAAARLKFD